MTKKVEHTNRWKMHEFFAGSGLVASGLQQFFEPIWANDISPQKATVYRANFENNNFLLSDIKNVSGSTLPYAHLSWASFPCQDLSLAGCTKGIHAERSGLVWEWLRVLDELSERPKLLLLENVVGLLSTKKGENYRVLHEALNERGYKCGAIVVDASLFVPQSRPRVFIIAVEKSIVIPPNLYSSEPTWLHSKAARELGPTLKDWIWWNTTKPSPRTQTLEDIVDPTVPFDKDYVLDLLPPSHKQKLEASPFPYMTGYRRTRNGQQCLEIRTDGIAGCLRTPEGGSSKQFLISKADGEVHARLLSVREVARLMGAPDTFQLPGSYNDGYKAMGDAVARPVAEFIGERFLSVLARSIYED